MTIYFGTLNDTVHGRQSTYSLFRKQRHKSIINNTTDIISQQNTNTFQIDRVSDNVTRLKLSQLNMDE